MWRPLGLSTALVAAMLIAVLDARPPAPAPARAAATEFSAERAMADVAVIASAPHPTGSAQNARVRDHLLARMTALGLNPQVRRDEGVNHRTRNGELFISGARIETIVGVLPGRDRDLPAVALMSHYDSAPGSAGAGDDAAGVAAALEIARALKAQGPQERDVMLLLTDGEEPGLLGAEAFFARDPLARRIGLVLNMEARGQGGRVAMFQTSPQNGALIELFSQSARRPQASSLFAYVYASMPNDTDLTISNAAQIPGLNYAFVGRYFDYHAPTATPANLDRGSLQDLGVQVLAMTQSAAAARELPRPAPDVTFSQVFGDFVLAYPTWAGWLVLAAAAGLLGLGLARAGKSEPLVLADVARGAGGLLFAAVGGAAVLRAVRRLVGAGHGDLQQRALLAHEGLWQATLVILALGFVLWSVSELARGRRRIALVPLIAGVACSVLGGLDPLGLGLGVAATVLGVASFGRPASRASAWAGVVILVLIFAGLAQVLAPPTAYILAWPATAAALGAAATGLSTQRGVGACAWLAVLAALGLGWMGAAVNMLFLGLGAPEAMAVCAALAGVLIWPLAHPPEGAPAERKLGPALLVVGLILAAVVTLDPPWSARNPKATRVLYHQDQDTGLAWRASMVPPTGWVRQALAGDGGEPIERSHWMSSRRHLAAPATPVGLAPVQTALASQADGSLRLTVTPPPATQEIGLRLRTGGPMTLAQIGGRVVQQPLPAGRWNRVNWRSGGAPLSLILRPDGPGQLDLRWTAVTDGWPAGTAPLSPRPADEAAFEVSDVAVVTGSRRWAW